MNYDHLYAVIMAGGIGSRLWPRSRSATPKQFLDLTSERSMLRETVDRIQPLVPLERILVVTGEEHRETVLSQVPGLTGENILAEPAPKGTAPCIGLAAVALLERDEDAIMAVFPADHVIADAGGFRRAIAAAAHVAEDGQLVTLGIAPDRPETGYGYIQRGDLLGTYEGQAVYYVERFTEKPDEDRARSMVESGDYYWNGGIFIWEAATIMWEMAGLLPELHGELQAVAKLWGTPGCEPRLQRAWQGLTPTTIDYGVMEKAERVVTVPVDVGWNDVGNWAALSALLEAGEDGNVVRGPGRVLAPGSKGCYLYASKGRLVAAVGLEDFVVVDTPDALLVCPKDQAQNVREVVQELQERGLEEYL
ncbi:MAG: NTP transferase domain-containing protein [Anaerolineaceae bacterium]|nr:NTP transferase domain-containing protein [Anaerolineaceae bacterium]